MTAWLQLHYPWIVALHLIAVISWMAGMFYLPRLYAYHADAEKGSVQSETFKIMEYRLLRLIINPAMIAAWLLGALLIALQPEILQQGWLHVKLGCLVLLQICHALFAALAQGVCPR